MEIRIRQPYSFCQIGRRGNQEDARYPDADRPEDCKPAFVVCDGVGGADKGEVASRTVADALGDYMKRVDLGKPFSEKDFGKALDYAYDRLNRAMSRDTREMATTMTFVAFHDRGAMCAHMGDSRIYHVRPGVGIIYRSEDHSLVNALVHSGNITPEEAIDHPQSNVITRCLAYVEYPEDRPNATLVQIADVQPGDYFFLCSDGVVHEVSDDELVEILSSDRSDAEKIEILARMSKDSADNNTAYLIGVDEVISDGGAPSADIAPEENADTSGATTAPLREEREVARQIAPSSKENKSALSRFFKKIFR